jgi:hypothetical protein
MVSYNLSIMTNLSIGTKRVPIVYGHHDLSTLLLGKVLTKRSELVDMVEPTSS